MIRFRVPFLLVFFAASVLTEEKVSNNPKPPDKLVLQKSKPYSQSDDGLIGSITNWIKNPLFGSSEEQKSSSEDLTASAAEYFGAKYLAPPANFRGYARNCYDCNSEPWIPIAGRSLHLPTGPTGPSSSSHSNNVDHNSHRPYFKEKHHSDAHHHQNNNNNYNNNNKQFSLYHPPIDQYGAPQGSFDFPPAGEVVDFMLPPPYKSGGIISGVGSLYGPPISPSYGPPRNHQYGPPKVAFGISNLSPPPFHPQKLPPHSIYKSSPPSINNNYGTPLGDISPPPLVRYSPSSTPHRNYGPPPRKQILTTHLRPVSQDFHQPPLHGGGINSLPLENNLPPAVPSDSYGRPINSDHLLPSAPFSGASGYVEPITSGSGDSEEYNGKRVVPFKSLNHFLNFESQQSAEIKQSLYHKGLTDVQVVPSVRIADYTASIEHPINLIQSPILDLNVNDPTIKISQNLDGSVKQKLSENPIIVDDTYTSASNINSTFSSEDVKNDTIKRHNDKFLMSSEAFSDLGNEDKSNNKEFDVTDSIIQKLILEDNIIQDPTTQIVGIQKSAVVNPQRVRTNLNVLQPSMDYNSAWAPTLMVPPKPSQPSTWLTPVNESFVAAKHPKKLQIVVPYLNKAQKDWSNNEQSTAVYYNKEYTTLAPVFVPPPVTTEASNLWTQFAEGLRTVEAHKEHAHGFAKPSSTTEIYNIKDFIAKQHQTSTSRLPYDIISLQRHIDDWTHQAYSNRHHNLEGKLTTKLAHFKEIPEEYFTTTTPSSSGYDDDDAIISSGSNKKEFISNEIDDNLILPDEVPTTTEAAKVRFVLRQSKPLWETDKVTLSNSTHEKVYMVTPQSYVRYQTSTPQTAFSMAPRIQNGRVNNVATMTKIRVRVEAGEAPTKGKEKPVKVVYSEWPHLINDLATTTTQRPTTRHPLFGLMDLAPYTAPSNNLVETIGGHSKVSNVVTPPLVKYSSTTPMPAGTNFNQTVKISPVK